MIEVVTYIFMVSLDREYNLTNNYIQDHIDTLIELSGESVSTVKPIINRLMSTQYKPSTMELAIAINTYNIPIRRINALVGMSSTTYYKYIDAFIDAGEETNPIYPKLDEGSSYVIANFIKSVKSFYDTTKGIF